MSDGDLGERARLRRLKSAVQPWLGRMGYQVRHPWDLRERDRIMNAVIKAIDRADLVIVDITDHNPNVFYELAVCHALGIPTILIREKPKADSVPVPFDIRDFYYYDIEVNKPRAIRDLLEEKIAEVDKQIAAGVIFDNPLTLYYKEPITNISPAAGLAQGYFHNFVKPVVENLKALNPAQTEHLYYLRINEGTDEQEKIIEWRARDVRRHIKLHIVIPERLMYCTEKQIERVKSELKQAFLQNEKRHFTIMARLDEHTYQLVDLPSTMSVMIASVNKRAGELRVRRDSEEWLDIERNEINRFRFELEQWIKEHEDSDFEKWVKIQRYSHESVTDDVLWLRNIWKG
jgi:hypothetical protein